MSDEGGDDPPGVRTADDHDGSAFVYELDDQETVSEGVVVAVSAIANRSPTELTPLYRTLDTDALDQLTGRHARTQASRAVQLTFEYEGYTVTVHGDHEIQVWG